MPFLRAKNLQEQELDAVLMHVEQAASSPSWMIVQGPATIRFEVFKSDRILPDLRERGRIFGTQGELRWRFYDGAYRTVFLGHENWIGEMLENHDGALENLTATYFQMLLCGERKANQDYWAENLIPQKLHYPLDEPAARVTLKIENWRDAAHRVHYSRFCRIVPYPGKESRHATR